MSHVEINTAGLDYLRGSAMNVIIRKALNKAAAPAKQQAVQKAPKDLGNLSKSMRIKTKYYKASKTWVAVVGVSTSFKRSAGRKALTRRVVWRGKGQRVVTDELVKKYIWPNKYALARENRRPFMKPAYDASKHLFGSILVSSIRVQLALLPSQ